MTVLQPSGPTAIRHRIRGRIAGAFLDAHAIGPEDAVAFVPQAGRETRMFARLLAVGILRETKPGFFYYDLSTYYARAEARRRWSVPAAVIVAVTLAVVLMLANLGVLTPR